jgi:hypothetical protein
MKHSSKFAFPQTRLLHTITLSALDGSNKHQQFIEILAKETHIMHTLSSFTSWYKVSPEIAIIKHWSSIIYEEQHLPIQLDTKLMITYRSHHGRER